MPRNVAWRMGGDLQACAGFNNGTSCASIDSNHPQSLGMHTTPLNLASSSPSSKTAAFSADSSVLASDVATSAPSSSLGEGVHAFMQRLQSWLSGVSPAADQQTEVPLASLNPSPSEALDVSDELGQFFAQLGEWFDAQGVTEPEIGIDAIQAVPEAALLESLEQLHSLLAPWMAEPSKQGSVGSEAGAPEGPAEPISVATLALSDAQRHHLRKSLAQLFEAWQTIQRGLDSGVGPVVDSRLQSQMFSLQQLLMQQAQTLRQWANDSNANHPAALVQESDAPVQESGALELWLGPRVGDGTKWLNPSETQSSKPSVFFSVNQPMAQQQEWHRAMIARLQWMTNEQISRAHISLNPARLGPIEVMMSVREGQVQVSLQAKHAETRKTLAQLSESLKASLSQQGLQLTQFLIGTMETSDDLAQERGRQVFESKLTFQQAREASGEFSRSLDAYS